MYTARSELVHHAGEERQGVLVRYDEDEGAVNGEVHLFVRRGGAACVGYNCVGGWVNSLISGSNTSVIPRDLSPEVRSVWLDMSNLGTE